MPASSNDPQRCAGEPIGRTWLCLCVVAIISSYVELGNERRGHLEAQGSPCGAFVNPIVCENQKTGDPVSAWDINGVSDATIQGFATEISVNRGETVQFKIDTDATTYRIDLYRLGYYGGLGARKVESLPNLPGQQQPPCLSDTATGLIDCGNWTLSASWPTPHDATSGIYLAKLVRGDTGGASHIVFVVRDDEGRSDLIFQTADTTWQAYNRYGGNSLYVADGDAFPTLPGRAFKVSYNRPFTTRDYTPEDWLFNAEYPMLRWLEANGYDVSYTTGVDTDRRGGELLEHEVFLSVGHDEYWSGTQRANVEAARDHATTPVHLAFFSGNEVYWKTRWEHSVDGSNTPYRTLVSYKETKSNAKIDPSEVWTGTWRDARSFNPEGPRPENALTGTSFAVNCCSYAINVPAADGRMRFWRDTSVAALAADAVATLADGTLGYEWDEDLDNGARPPGLIHLSTTTEMVAERIQDYGSTYGPGVATHHLTLYRAASGALVFGGGTVQWAWGLDDMHYGGDAAADPRMQQATVNLLADMGVQPGTLQPGLVAAQASGDATPPASAITWPGDGAALTIGNPVTITGTALDTGGGMVGGVEVSIDGGATWHAVGGRESWSVQWTPPVVGTVNIRSRAVDDSGRMESPSPGVSVAVQSETTPPAIVAVSPSNGAFDIDINAPVSATFSEAIDAGTINGTTFEIRDALNGLVAAIATYVASHHTVVLDPAAPLIPSTWYTATVKGGVSGVKDVAGNPLTADFTWGFTTAAIPTFLDTTVADFAAGTSAGVSVTHAVNGEVALAPSLAEEFSGTTLPAGWSSDAHGPEGAVVVGGGMLTIDGARAATDAAYGPGGSLEFVATFGSAPWQHVGVAADLDFNEPWAIFSTFSATTDLYARTSDGANTPIPGDWLNSPHHYRIDWQGPSVAFWIDGVQVASHEVTIAGDMRPLASDFETGGASLSVDWLRMVPPYRSSGSFASRIFDAGEIASWGTLSWTSQLEAGASLAMSVRTGETPTPDATWTTFTAIPISGGAIADTSRYAQYRATLTTSDPAVTPILHDVTIGYRSAPPLAANDAASPLEDIVLTVAAPGVLANDQEPNGKPLTAILVNHPANAAAFSFSSDGAFSYRPNTNFNGTDTFTYQSNNGSRNSEIATVTIAVAAVNDAPAFTAGANQTVTGRCRPTVGHQLGRQPEPRAAQRSRPDTELQRQHR